MPDRVKGESKSNFNNNRKNLKTNGNKKNNSLLGKEKKEINNSPLGKEKKKLIIQSKRKNCILMRAI